MWNNGYLSKTHGWSCNKASWNFDNAYLDQYLDLTASNATSSQNLDVSRCRILDEIERVDLGLGPVAEKKDL